MVRAFIAVAVIFYGLLIFPANAKNDDKYLTIIHTGDFHGHLVARANVRSDGDGRKEGGLARIFTVIQGIRAEEANTLLIHSGDTIQGSAETLYTRGQAMVDVLNQFDIDAFAPGNWDFVYGTERFLELFAPGAPLAPWNAIGANVRYSTLAQDPTTPYPDRAGERVLPPYVIKQIGEVKVGILGLTTDRGPQIVGGSVTKGFVFLQNGTELDAEIAARVQELRNTENVDILIVASEMGLANNIRIAEAIAGIDIILSSDMHEETVEPVVTTTGTVIVEEGQDGTMIGKLKLKLKDRRIKKWDWTPIRIDDSIPEDSQIAALVTQVRSSFVTGTTFAPQVNPFNGSVLKRPIDTVVGYTAIPLHRSNFSDEPTAGVIEGSSHDFLTDAFRAVTGAQIGAIRGFRFGTHVVAGPITQEDLYHFVPIGPQIAIGTITGQALKNQIEVAASGSLNPDLSVWTGGWLAGFSGVTMDIDPFASTGNRASNILVEGTPLSLSADYTYASYWYTSDPTLINTLPADNVSVMSDTDGSPLDGTEVVVRYLQSAPSNTVNPTLNRIHLLQPLPARSFDNKEVQPVRGAPP